MLCGKALFYTCHVVFVHLSLVFNLGMLTNDFQLGLALFRLKVNAKDAVDYFGFMVFFFPLTQKPF